MNIVEWLLDSDPAIRWQVMRDLIGAPAEEVAAERARVAKEGWGARLLALQREDGQWDGGSPTFKTKAGEKWWRSLPPERRGTLFPEWTSTAWSLMLLRQFGLDPASAEARRAVHLVREHVQWEHAGEPFFAGEVEPCINGKATAIGAYFGENVEPIVDRLLGEQMSDGGWTCARQASLRTSGWPRRSSWSYPSAVRTAAGHSRIPIPAACTSRWMRGRANRAGGTRCEPCACSGGTRLRDPSRQRPRLRWKRWPSRRLSHLAGVPGRFGVRPDLEVGRLEAERRQD